MLLSPKRQLGAVLSAAAMLFASGCGLFGIDGPGSSGDTVPVEHQFGTTDLPVGAKSIVSMVPGYTDAIVALGEQPTAVSGFAGFPSAMMPWDEGKLQLEPEGPTKVLKLQNPSDVPFEQIADAEPDTILVSSMATDQSIYDRLSAMAPTIPAREGGKLDKWQEQTRLMGQLLGKEDDTDKLVADTEQVMKDVSAQYPNAKGKTITLALYGGPDNIQVVTDPEDPGMEMFTQMGLRIPDQLVGLGGGEQGVQGRVSLANLDMLDAGIILMGSMVGREALDNSALWQNLDAVKNGRVLDLDVYQATSFRVPTVLSVPWSVEVMRPALEKL